MSGGGRGVGRIRLEDRHRSPDERRIGAGDGSGVRIDAHSVAVEIGEDRGGHMERRLEVLPGPVSRSLPAPRKHGITGLAQEIRRGRHDVWIARHGRPAVERGPTIRRTRCDAEQDRDRPAPQGRRQEDERREPERDERGCHVTADEGELQGGEQEKDDKSGQGKPPVTRPAGLGSIRDRRDDGRNEEERSVEHPGVRLGHAHRVGVARDELLGGARVRNEVGQLLTGNEPQPDDGRDRGAGKDDHAMQARTDAVNTTMKASR